MTYLSNTYDVLDIHTNPIELNNAFEYNQATLDTKSTDRSMWFATNATSIIQLNAGQ